MPLKVEFLSNHARTIFLARLANVLTVCARDTYEVGTERVLQPDVLRDYNELLHRVTGAVSDHLLGKEGYPIEDILEMMREFGARHNRAREMNWAMDFASKEPTREIL